MKELIVLASDGQQKAVIEVLLEKRYKSLHICKLVKGQNFDVYPLPNKDPGVYKEAGQFLSVFEKQYQYALVLIDSEWEGSPGQAKIKEKIQKDLNQNGWTDRSSIIVIDPELEIWVWSSSDEIPEILGQSWEQIHELAEKHDFWSPGDIKPRRPKELMDSVLREGRKHRSAALFQKLAEKISLRGCQDLAFQDLREKLHEWFPPE
jgi:hypothetical protein